MPALDFPSSPANGQTYGGYYWDASTGAWRSDPVPMGGLPAGSIIQWAGSTAPANWLMADGAAVSRTTYASLFAAIGTTYGAGDGSTTFNLPDLRGRVAVGKNAGTFGTLGATGGAETHTLTIAQMPVHTHTMRGPVWKESGGNVTIRTDGGAGASVDQGVQTGETGGGAAHNNLQPYQVVNYIIKATAGWSAGDSELAQRVGVLEAAPAGLVRVVPTSVAVGSGSASVSSTGIVTFTNAGNVGINGCFTSAYKNYRVVFRLTGTSVWLDCCYRSRATGTDATDSTYYYAGSYQRNDVNGFGGSYNGAAATTARLGAVSTGSTGVGHGVYDIFAPQAAEWTSGSGVVWGYQGSFAWHQIAFTHANAGSFDGFDFFPSAGTFSGTLQIYGYRN